MDDSTKEPEVTEETVEAAPEEEVEKDTKRDTKKDTSAPDDKPAAARKGLSTPVWVALVVVALVVGVLGGHFLLGGIGGSSLSGKTTLSEDQLDSVMGTYTYGGKTYDVTARDVITTQSSLSSAKQEDGSYKVPAADGVVSYARSAILAKAAEDQGISISDEDRDAYAQSTLGNSDYDSIASSYGMDADTVKKLISQSAAMSKLRDSVVTTNAGTAPTAPTKPADGQQDAATSDYAQYVIGLAGSEWDADNNGWAATDGPYATALSNYTITNDSATYEAAQAAYYVAYQQYSSTQSVAKSQWTNYVNGLLCNASISVFSLVA
ncbi:hypothetical protein [Olsenella uli]|uniref:hypothetical protein n=1 Tax=Olsenella uli TaxID=133926 RepID=UPI0028E71D46|nr:hypothetical protein [Olsenella uli]